ncbi:MAG: serine/threonine protein kinase, partial [Anaerolineae bacterium]|nr:serine/threonine protein kinase [Anaerolineae bacterium]
RDNRVVLSDFGLAMDTGQGSLGQIFGTPHYIAPEQAKRSADAIPQSDLYSFGVLLYEMLTGEVPFDDVSATGLALQHMTQPPPSPRSLNPALNLDTEKVLLRALSKEPENRFASGKEMIEALEKALKKKSRAKSLPPLPAGVEPPARVLSMKTVSHRVAAFDHNTLPRPAIDAVFPLPAIPAAQNHSTARQGFSWRGLFWALLGSLTTLAFAGLLLLFFNLLLADTASETPVPLQEGKPVLLLYNENNFYMQNTGEQSIEVGKLKFEALDSEGISRAVFYGTRWSGTDPLLDPNACMSLEYYIDSVSAFPQRCPGREAYVELSSISEFVFWTARRGAVEFRVMWNGSEVGRCPVTGQTADAAECRIYLP